MAMLSAADKEELMKLDANTITLNDIARLFGKTAKKGSFKIQEPKFKTTDTFNLKAGEYINTKDIETTIGSFLFNKLMIESTGVGVVVPGGYVNEEMTKKAVEKLFNQVARGLETGKIPIDPVGIKFLQCYENWSLTVVPIFSPSFTSGLVNPDPKFMEEIKSTVKHADLSRTEDMIRVEDHLVDRAKEVTANDPGIDIFSSGARGSFENDFKNMMVTIGPIQSPTTGEFHFMTSNYMTGLKKTDLAAAGNIIVNAEYPKAVGTAKSGYQTKQMYAVLQTLILDDEGTDCHSKTGLKVHITKDNGASFIDQYVMDTKGLVLLTYDNIADYYGKEVLLRSPMTCTSDKICSVCAGKRLYNRDMRNLGLLSAITTNTILEKNMKLRHSMKMDVDDVDIDTLIMKRKKTK